MQANDNPLIMLEFNELTRALMMRFMEEGHLPNFSRLYRESEIFVTDAEVEGNLLNPWVQWVTVHSGLSAEQHGIGKLSEGAHLSTPAVWDLLSENGYRVWICGSMNARYDKPLNGSLIPDAWSSGLRPYPPKEFDAFYDFVRDSVQEHSNEHKKSSAVAAAKFVGFLAMNGLSLKTVSTTIRQVIGERVGQCRWKRAALMDRFQWDVFQSRYRKLQPHFSTFFLNSTAHFQHKYWRNMEPESFGVTDDAKKQKSLKNAILFGYQSMDELVGRCLKLVGDDACVVFCTGLGQQPYLKAELKGGKRHYRASDGAVFSQGLGAPAGYRYDPVMAEQCFLRYADVGDADRAAQILTSYRLDGEQAMNVRLQENDVFVTCRIRRKVREDEQLESAAASRSVGFFDVFYEMDGLKSGCHHPQGMLWVRRPDKHHSVHEDPVSIRSIAPGVLGYFGLDAPSTMRYKPCSALMSL